MLYRIGGIVVLVLFIVFSFTGCGAYATSPVTGFLITDVSAPIGVGSGIRENLSVNIGEASAHSLFGLFAWGDASIQAAAKDGSIEKISYVDAHRVNVFGLYSKYTVKVYGQ